MAEREHWSFDKRIPVAIVVTIVIQTLGVVWAASALWSQVQAQEQRLNAIEAQKVESRLSRLEEAMLGVKAQLDRMEGKIDRISAYPAKP